jgi:linoleoyl-CoA desaturase
VNRAAVFGCFAILGIDGARWRDRHLRLHHRVPNLPGTGIDADSVTLLRLAPDKPWRPWHRFQPAYAPLLYAAGHAGLAWIDDWAMRCAADRAGCAGLRAGRGADRPGPPRRDALPAALCGARRL